MSSAFSRARVRASALYAVVWLAVAWSVLLLADMTGVWQLYFLSVLLAAWGTSRDISKEGLFHPALVFGCFSLLVVAVNLLLLAVHMYDVAPFFSFKVASDPSSVRVLTAEQLVLFSATYVGYLLVGGVAGRTVEHASVEGKAVDSAWWLLYFVGVGALLALVLSSGGFAELFSNWGEKYERAAGRGELVILQYFAYAGILLWFRKNLFRPALQRYGGLVALSLPMLLSGSRSEMLICLVAALYMDERTGKRFNLATLVPLGLALTLFFAVYQALRGQAEVAVIPAVYKDLSMGMGYVVAVKEGIVGDQFRPGVLVYTVTPLLPSAFEGLLNLPPSPAYVLTQHLFPGFKGTVSMGVLGEANYVLRSGWSPLYYLVLGAALTWVGSIGWRYSPLLAAVVAGSVVRIVKSGGTIGVANMLLFLLPIVVAYLATYILSRKSPSKAVLQTSSTGSEPSEN